MTSTSKIYQKTYSNMSIKHQKLLFSHLHWTITHHLTNPSLSATSRPWQPIVHSKLVQLSHTPQRSTRPTVTQFPSAFQKHKCLLKYWPHNVKALAPPQFANVIPLFRCRLLSSPSEIYAIFGYTPSTRTIQLICIRGRHCDHSGVPTWAQKSVLLEPVSFRSRAKLFGS